MIVGENSFTYTDQSPGERKVRITHEWMERTVRRPAAARGGLSARRRPGRGHGLRFPLERAARTPDGEKITDSLFMLSDKADAKLPLSTNFYKLISRTADKGKPQQYTLPYTGLLTGGKQYYWRVRAKDEKGVWSPWSKTFSFTHEGPELPAGGRTQLRQGQGNRHPEVEGQPGRREAGEVPRLRQRREGLFRERRAVHRQRRHLEGAEA